jgi:hypothetical protein
MTQFFLDKVSPFEVNQWADMERRYSNWLKVSSICYSITDVAHLTRMLQLELMGKRRQIILDRVYSRLSALRAQREYPIFFKQFDKPVEWTGEEQAKYNRLLISWDHTVGYVDRLDLNPLPELLRLMHFEYGSKRRRYLLHRLFTKFQTVRRKMEKRDMMRWRLKRGPNGI